MARGRLTLTAARQVAASVDRDVAQQPETRSAASFLVIRLEAVSESSDVRWHGMMADGIDGLHWKRIIGISVFGICFVKRLLQAVSRTPNGPGARNCSQAVQHLPANVQTRPRDSPLMADETARKLWSICVQTCRIPQGNKDSPSASRACRC